MPTLYTFGNAANVSANNFTTLYNSGAGVVNPQLAYGNANVEDFLAVGSDPGGNTVGNIIASGNITAQNFFGNVIGNLLVPGNTGEVLFNTADLADANSNFVFNAGNATLTVTGGVVTGNIDATGNISAAGNVTGAYFIGNGSQLTGLPAVYGNANVAAYLASGTDSSNIVTTANVTGGNITTSGIICATGNISAAGNVWGQYLIANTAIWFGYDVPYEAITSDDLNMSFYTNGQRRLLLTSGYANIQGDLFLSNIIGNGILHSYGANVVGAVSATGNITGNYFIGNGSQLTGIVSNYGNANVATFLGNFGSNVVSTTGNVTASYFVGNGSQLTGLPAGYANSDVANYLASGTNSSNIITTGNITGSYFFGNGSQLTGLPEVYGNANVANFLANFGSNTITTTGNIDAGNLSTTGNVTISGTLNSDDITSSNVTVYGDQVITGNLTVQGNTTTINSNVVTTNDKTITVANNQSTGANVNGAGLEAGNAAIATWLYNDATGSWQSNIAITPVGNLTQDLGKNTNRWATVYANAVSATGNITGNYIIGNGSQLTGLPAGYSNADVANYLASGTDTSNIITTANITGGNIVPAVDDVGTLGSPNLHWAMLYASSANITAGLTVGIFASVVGNVTAGNIRTGGLVSAAGNIVTPNYVNTNSGLLFGSLSSRITESSGTISIVANNVSEVSIGSTGVNISNANLNVSSSASVTGNVTAGNILTVGIVSAAGNITAPYFIGNGYTLTATNGANVIGDVPTAVAAESVQIPVKNTSGGTLTIGTPVYATGAVGATTTLEVSASRADTASTMGAIGLLTSTLGINGTGYAMSVGTLTGVDTSLYTVGQVLYVGATGGLVGTRPTDGNIVQTLGAIGRVNASTGSIEVNIWNVNPLPNLGTGNIWIGNAAAYPTETTLSAYTGNIGAGNVSVSGNVSAAYFVGNGSALTSITGGNVTGQVGNALVAGTVYTNAQPNITSVGTLSSVSVSGNTTVGNLLTVGVVSATGNVTGNFILGNGYYLTGISGGSYGNTDVANFLASGSLTTAVSTTGNVIAGNVTTSGLISAAGNAIAGNVTTSGLISAAGNAIAGNITTSGLISATGNVIAGNITTSGLISAAGNLTSSGVRTEFNSLTKYTQFNYVTSATGNVAIDKVNGQVQMITPTGNITITGYSNLVTSITSGSTYAQADTLTIVITQSNPSYTVTMPTGNTYKYAGNIKAVGTTANAVTMISVTAANIAGTVTYLTTISPEFV